MSSISNLQFVGVKDGWIGERSTPMMSAPGCSEHVLLVECMPKRDGSRAIGHVHTPNACAASEVKYAGWVGNRGEVELIIEQYQEHVVRNVELVVLNFLEEKVRVSVCSQGVC